MLKQDYEKELESLHKEYETAKKILELKHDYETTVKTLHEMHERNNIITLHVPNKITQDEKKQERKNKKQDEISKKQEKINNHKQQLHKFLTENTRFKKCSMLLIEDVCKTFGDVIGKSIRKLDHDTFYQINKEYIIETTKICKHCKNFAKKSCCEYYKNSERICRTIIRNIEFNEL